MSRSPSCVAAVLAATLIAGPAAAQTTGPSGATNPGGPVSDLTFPVEALEFPVTSLDGNVSVSGRRVILQADVLFAFGSAKLGPRAKSRIADAVAAIRDKQPKAVRVLGFTDSKGSDSYNDGLSRRRAAAVEKALGRVLGDDAPPFRAEGRGEAQPVAQNTVDGKDNPKGRAKNRRVELRYG